MFTRIGPPRATSRRRLRNLRRPSVAAAAGMVLGVVVAWPTAVVTTMPSVASSAASAQTAFTFAGGGWGHGVGMSQYGAKGRADAGQSTGDILAAYYPTTAIETRNPAGPRVQVADTGATELTVSGGTLWAIPDGGTPVAVAAAGERISVRNFAGAVIWQRVDNGPGPINSLGTSPVAVRWDAGQAVTLSATGRSYSYGSILVVPGSSSNTFVVRDLTMEQYLYGLGEMPASWHPEALRAQAIAGRSFAAYRLAHPQNANFDLYASVSDQAYVGTTQTASASGPAWVAAVDATAGQVLTSGGNVIQAFYSSSNGGHTERSDYVWSATLPYFVAVPDPFDQNAANPNGSWTRTFSGEELAAWLSAAGRGAVGSVTSVSIGGNVGASGRVDKATVTVVGTTRMVTMTGAQFRSAINAGAPAARDLLSTKFALTDAAPTVAPAAPASAVDRTPPDLKFLNASPMRFGSSGTICAFVLSDETAIYGLHIRLRGVDLRSPVGGVGPTSPQIGCITIPARLRPRRATSVVLTAAALDANVNIRFVQRTVTIAR